MAIYTRLPHSYTPPMPAYTPDDANLTPAALEALAADLPLREKIAALLASRPNQQPTVADIAALRKSIPADLLHAALTLGSIQKKAAAKFPALHTAAGYVYATPEALEQATGEVVAAHVASRFAPLAPTALLDLCCGIGGNALALATLAPTTAIDLSKPRTTCLQLNAKSLPPHHRLTILPQDVTVHSLFTIPHSLFHIDPARRSAGRRSPKYEDLLPGPDFLAHLLRTLPGGAIKLSPAVDFDSLPPGHLELLSHRGTVVQALLYTGALADQFQKNTRTATILSPTHPPFSFTHQAQGLQSLGPLPTDGAYLYELDGALTRANLAAPFASSLSLFPLTPDAGYLTSESLLTHPALTPFQVTAALPFNEKKILAHLKDLPPGPPGPIEVKTRGGLNLKTDLLQKSFSAATPTRHTLFIFLHEKALTALFTTRL